MIILTAIIGSSQILGAALDVTDPEPLPKNHPLLNYKNVLVTPHIAGISDNFKERSFNLICSNINRYHKGQDLINIVNKKKQMILVLIFSQLICILIEKQKNL